MVVKKTLHERQLTALLTPKLLDPTADDLKVYIMGTEADEA